MPAHALLPNSKEEREKLVGRIKKEMEKLKKKKGRVGEEAQQKRTILQERVRLIPHAGNHSQTRIGNLQKMFHHYCTHIFVSGRNMSFDRIGDENKHLIMERLFAIIQDFNLNQIVHDGKQYPLAEKNQIGLLFKKSASDARNLDFPQFVTCLQRCFVLFFNQTREFSWKLEKKKEEKAIRLQQMKQKEAKRNKKIRERDAAIEKSNLEAQGIVDQPVAEGDAQSQNPEKPKSQKDPKDKMLKESSNKEKKGEAEKTFQMVSGPDPAADQDKGEQKQKSEEGFDPYEISDEEKIETYMERIGADHMKEMRKKMRVFENCNYRYTEEEEQQKLKKIKREKSGFQPRQASAPKQSTQTPKETRAHDKNIVEKDYAKRLQGMKQRMQERDSEREKLHMSRVLSNDKYERKKNSLESSFKQRQKVNMYRNALDRQTKREEEQDATVYYSLEMMNKSTPNQLPLHKMHPERYISADPTDPLYLEEYGDVRSSRGVRRGVEGVSQLGSIVLSARQKVAELEGQDPKRASRLTANRYKNHHYLQKFLQRKW